MQLSLSISFLSFFSSLLKSFILANKEAIEKLAIKNDEEKIIKKKDDWYNEECWDNLYEELKVGKKDE